MRHQELDGKIIECSVDPKTRMWVFMRVRIDKSLPNSTMTFEGVKKSIMYVCVCMTFEGVKKSIMYVCVCCWQRGSLVESAFG